MKNVLTHRELWILRFKYLYGLYMVYQGFFFGWTALKKMRGSESPFRLYTNRPECYDSLEFVVVTR
jgi:hypothetical protein